MCNLTCCYNTCNVLCKRVLYRCIYVAISILKIFLVVKLIITFALSQMQTKSKMELGYSGIEFNSNENHGPTQVPIT